MEACTRVASFGFWVVGSVVYFEVCGRSKVLSSCRSGAVGPLEDLVLVLVVIVSLVGAWYAGKRATAVVGS